MASRLGWHFQQLDGTVAAIAAASGAAYIKVMDPPSNNPFPGKQVIGRTYIPDDESNALVAQGAAGADAWFARCLPVYQSRGYVTWWEGPNEPQDIYSPAFRAALVAFTLRLTERLRNIGKKCVALNLSVGAPDILDIMDFRGLAGKIDAMGLHEYSAPTMQTGEGWYCLRYRKYKAAWAAAGLYWPATIITECGIDGGTLKPPRMGTGWKTYASRDAYMEQLRWYDSELARDPEVLAATIFTSGPDGVWTDFDFDADLSRRLAAHIASVPPVVTEPTLAERLAAAFGAQFHDLRAVLPTSTPPYERRALTAVRQVILHHTVTPQTTTWQTVANYHVNSRGWPGIGYHIGVHPDGRVSLLNDLTVISYHAAADNASSAAISVMGNYETDKVTDALWRRITEVKAVVDTHLGRVTPFVAHRDATGSQTACPGANLYARLTTPEVPPMSDPRASNCIAFHVNAAGQVDGIELVYQPVPSARYACVAAQLIDEAAAQGNTVVKVEIFDKDGIPTAERALMEWPYGGPPAEDSPVGPGNTDNRFTTTSKYTPPAIGPLGFFVGDASKQPISDHIWGYGLPGGRHISGYVAFKERGVVTPPVEPPTGNLELDIRNLAYNNINVGMQTGVPYNPTLAFPREANRLDLGAPQTLELRQLAGYVVQGFASGILYCVTGDWGNIKRLSW